MYEFIRGEIVSALPGCVILEAAGIGYRILVPLSTSRELGAPGDEAKLLVHHTINAEQGEEKLYGFATELERELFRALLVVKGIGPATAITVLCAANPDELIALIASGNVVGLRRFKGIGPKTAERIVTELRDRVALWVTDGAATRTATGPRRAVGDAVAALVALGYPHTKCENAVAKAAEKLGSGAAVEDIVRRALQVI